MRGCARVCSGRPFGRVILDLEAAPRERVADEARAVLVVLARRIDGRDADQLRREGDGLVGERVDGGEHAIGEHRVTFLQEARKVVKPPAHALRFRSSLMGKAA